MLTLLPDNIQFVESTARGITDQDDMTQYLMSLVLFLVDRNQWTTVYAIKIATNMLAYTGISTPNHNYDLVMNAYEHILTLIQKAKQ